MIQRARDKNIDNSAILPAVLKSYIPKQLLKNVKFAKCYAMSVLEYVQKVLDNSNDSLRMYGSAESLLASLYAYMEFPLSRKMFPREMGSYYYTIPSFYQNLKKEVLYCKQDLLFYLQSCVYAELRLHGDEYKVKFAELIEYMRKHEERLSGCYEFVKYNDDVFEDIRKPFFFSRSLYVFPKDAVVTAVPYRTTRVKSHEETDFLKVFDNLISKYPCFFLPNSETKDRNATAVVRIFDDGNLKYVMESELFAAINLKNPDQKPLECMDVEGHYRTIDYKHVLELYKDQIGDIDFIHSAFPISLHIAIPIAAPTGDHCIRAVDAQEDILFENILALGVFQKITRNTCHMIPKFVAILEKYFPSNITYRYFINLKLLQKLRKELEEFWKPIKDTPVKRVRNVGPEGFTVEDFKKELKYLGYTEIFPEITADAREAYTAIFFSLKPSDLKTSDMFAAIQASLTIVLTTRYPCFNEFVYRQKVCLHNRIRPCEPCSNAFKEAEARIEAEIKAESEQASSSVTGTTSGNDSEKGEASEESKHELVTSEALPIVQRDPENLRDSVESSFAEAETKEIPAVLELEVSEHNPVLSYSNDQKIPREPCLKVTKEAEFQQAPFTVTAITAEDDVIKKENSEESEPESVTSETSSVAINNPVEPETNPFPTISEPEVPEYNPVLSDSDTHICEKCMETSNEAREEVIETYGKMMILEKKLKEKDAELERLKVYEEKSKKSDETEKKSKDLEKEAEGWKMKYFKILEENVKMGNMLKSTGKSKALESQVKEKDEQLKVAQQALEEKDRKFQKLEKTIKEKDEELYDLSEVLNQEKEGFKVSFNGLLTQLVDKDKEIVELKNTMTNAEASWLEAVEKFKGASSELVKKVNVGLEQLEIKDSKIQELELKNSKLTEEKNQEIEELKKQQAMATKEDKKEIEQLKRNASTSADELKKLTAIIAEKEGAENLLKRSNKGLLEKLQNAESSLKETINKLTYLETDVAEKNRTIVELQKSAENQVSEQEKAKEELEAQISTIREMLDAISPPESKPEDKPDTECLICFFEMKPNQKTLKCDHCRKIVHLKCAAKWHKTHRSCAHCRREQLNPNEFPRLQ
ncbi:unnamed protein product [Caenorhabditis brenneri]